MAEPLRKQLSVKSTRRELGHRYKMAHWANLDGTPFKRHIDKESYIGMQSYLNKTEAQELAAKYRRMGYLARVIADWPGWTVYVRKGEL